MEIPENASVTPAIRFTRRRLLKIAGLGAATLAGTFTYSNQVERFYTEFSRTTVRISGLPQGFDGLRIAHLSDLHVGPLVPESFIERTLDRVNAAKPDLILLSGDVIHHEMDCIPAARRLLARLQAPTFVSFGNHDYAPGSGFPKFIDILGTPLEKELTSIGCTVLRNRAVPFERAGERIWIAGLEDFYTGRFDPKKTWSDIPPAETVICLSHNPDSAEELIEYKPALIVSGHTHGGQIRLPLFGPILLPIVHREWYTGLTNLGDTQLYVSRGVGHLLPIRIFCRPEVPMLTLRSA